MQLNKSLPKNTETTIVQNSMQTAGTDTRGSCEPSTRFWQLIGDDAVGHFLGFLDENDWFFILFDLSREFRGFVLRTTARRLRKQRWPDPFVQNYLTVGSMWKHLAKESRVVHARGFEQECKTIGTNLTILLRRGLRICPPNRLKISKLFHVCTLPHVKREVSA